MAGGSAMRVALITISDGCFHGTREDKSGEILAAIVSAAGWVITSREILPDEQESLEARFRDLCDREKPELLLTTGGTGLGPRDVTPEATSSVADRLIPGIGELMRLEGLKKTPRAALSRSARLSESEPNPPNGKWRFSPARSNFIRAPRSKFPVPSPLTMPRPFSSSRISGTPGIT